MPKGKHLSKEHRQKISEALKGKMPRFIPDNSGRRCSLNTKQKISETLKRKGIRPPSREGIYKTDALTRKPSYRAFMEKRRELRKKDNGGAHTYDEWEKLKAQYNWTCPTCGRMEPDITLTHDHIIPIFAGGPDSIQNIQPLCVSCNSKKGTSTMRYEAWGYEADDG